MQENHYDLAGKEIIRRREYGVYEASRNYSAYLRNEGLISAGDQVVVKTSSRLVDTDQVVPVDQINELVMFLKHQNWENIPTVLHWVVGFSLPSKKWGVPLPPAQYKTPYRDEDGKLVKNPIEVDQPFIIDSHRFDEIKGQKHWLQLISKQSSSKQWGEDVFAPYPDIEEGEQFAKLSKLLQNKQCNVDCVYFAIPKDQMPRTW